MTKKLSNPSPPFWTIPNLLSLIRIPMAVALFIFPHSLWYILTLMVMAGVTDGLDGWVTRRRARQRGDGELDSTPGKEPVGTWLDPLCDKIFVLGMLVLIWLHYGATPFLLACLGAREILQMPAMGYFFIYRWRGGKKVFRFKAALIGKATTVVQFLAVVAFLFAPRSAPDVCYLAGIMGTVSVVHYLRRAWVIVHEE